MAQLSTCGCRKPLSHLLDDAGCGSTFGHRKLDVAQHFIQHFNVGCGSVFHQVAACGSILCQRLPDGGCHMWLNLLPKVDGCG